MEKKEYVRPALTVLTYKNEVGYAGSAFNSLGGLFDGDLLMFGDDSHSDGAAVSHFGNGDNWSNSGEWF